VQYPQTCSILKRIEENLMPPLTPADGDHSTRETPNRSSGFAVGYIVCMVGLAMGLWRDGFSSKRKRYKSLACAMFHVVFASILLYREVSFEEEPTNWFSRL